ncbi:glycerophosphodiester phosphodiesterase family protein [uncultured Luteimonas sp.]|uniref:glycerophosphodiester phosphodiesterase family protein n=1 Tax=uncultured Luteimonas sp. TaxID=453144 RepID=UPI00262B4C09|nr:glycerophosphodiester phosphodiesterase family protein [uncultured Luteimonas sp.]
MPSVVPLRFRQLLCACLMVPLASASCLVLASPPRLAPGVHEAVRASPRGPALIAHRGASALLPEHTLEAYARAIADGADFIEPDLVMTRDGVLVARHENELGSTTDVASRPEFAQRRTRRLVDGLQVEGWFVEDFGIDELLELRVRERLPELRGTQHDGRYRIPMFDEIVALVADAARREGRNIGLVPEIKSSSHLHARGLDPEQALVTSLRLNPYTRAAPVGVQSFEVANLRRLRDLLDAAGLRNVFLVQLIGALDTSPWDVLLEGRVQTYRQMLDPQGLQAMAGYADVVAPPLRAVLPLDARGALAAPTPLVASAHAAGLAVHVWTLRPENRFLPPALRCPGSEALRCEAGAAVEAAALAAAGVDAVFADDPGLVRRSLQASASAVRAVPDKGS